MSLVNVILIGISLSMDCVAVSMARGMTMKRLHLPHIARTAFFFGFFQMTMPLIGWLAGLGLHRLITRIDHWIAFGLLMVIGTRMVIGTFVAEKREKKPGPGSDYMILLTLAFATSIDALAVGLSFSFIGVEIITPVLFIGIVTFCLSFAAGLAGQRFGLVFKKKIEVLGGLILIGIGVKILLEHLRII